ncbi:MAG: hypothetical protein GQ533_03605 [Methanosarcinaceae archaeon]|nr:hypothetical protein [Methanosarcinaceae archaeon]
MNNSTGKEKLKPGQESQSISSKEVKRMNVATKKDKWWVYLIFFLIGILSFFTSVVSGTLFLLPLLICSILLAIAMYTFKKQSFTFALMAFTISFATSSLIFFTGLYGGGLLGVGFPSLNPLLILLVLSVIAWIVFKERPLVNFSLKAFVVSFGTIFIIFSAVFMVNSPLSLLFFFGAQDDATTSTGISIESSAENITIYVPVLLDENKTVLKMYETPQITGNVSTAIIDTEYGKALMISRSGLGDYLFNWNEVPGKDTDRFVRWLENDGIKEPGDKLDIKKTDDGNTLTVNVSRSGYRYDIGYTYRINEMKEMESRRASNGLYVIKEEKGQLNIYSGNNEIRIIEKYGILKEDTQTSDEFLKEFTISMSNYTSPEPFIQQPDSELRTIGVWVYSDSEVEKFSFGYSHDPGNRRQREVISIGTEGPVHLRKGWQVVNLSSKIICWD